MGNIFLILVETHATRGFGGLWIFLDWEKATTGRASCICRRFRSFKSFKSFRWQQGQKNQCHRGRKAPIYGEKGPHLWGKPLFMGILNTKGFL